MALRLGAPVFSIIYYTIGEKPLQQRPQREREQIRLPLRGVNQPCPDGILCSVRSRGTHTAKCTQLELRGEQPRAFPTGRIDMNDILPLILIGCLWNGAGFMSGCSPQRFGCAGRCGCTESYGYSRSCGCGPYGPGFPPSGGGCGGYAGRFDRDYGCGCYYRPHRCQCLPF